MPARAERIYIYPAEEGQPGQVMRFPIWWDRRGFFEKYGEREIDLGHPLYVDYAYLLTPGEALEWDKRCRAQFSANPGGKNPKVVSDMQRMELALKQAKWVIVESYEWESGLS
jgi:hypothetical protein